MGQRLLRGDKPKRETKKPRLIKQSKPKCYITEEGKLSHTPDYLDNIDIYAVTDWSKLSVAMQHIITKVYNVFSSYSAPGQFHVCTVCCMSIEEERALRTLPLALLPKQLIASYNNSAKPSQCNKHEIFYLLPCILELIALDECIIYPPELNLTWCSEVPCELRSNQEQELLNEFALQYFIDQFQHTEQNKHILYIDEILIMFDSAGIAIMPLLDYMIQANNFYVIASIAYLVASSKDPTKYITSFNDDNCNQINEIFNQWLNDNLNALKQQADQAILSPHSIATDSWYIKYHVELGLCYLPDRPFSERNIQ